MKGRDLEKGTEKAAVKRGGEMLSAKTWSIWGSVCKGFHGGRQPGQGMQLESQAGAGS